MKSRGLIFLMVALFAGVAAVMLGVRWIQEQSGGSGTRIAVAATEVELGSNLRPEGIRMVEWPASSVPRGAFRDSTELAGRVAIVSLQPGEPILESRLAPEGTRGGLSAVVEEGKRAITVRVNDVVGVAGFALPGNYVDIMVNTHKEDGGNSRRGEMISKIVLERILVLAVAQEASRDDTRPRVVNAVTLEVTPEEAERLDLARSVGNLSLVLRNQIDPSPGATEGITKAHLLRSGIEIPEPAPAPRRAAPRPRPAAPPVARTCVEIIRGTNRTDECF